MMLYMIKFIYIYLHKISEVRACVKAGINDIHLANEIVCSKKIKSLCSFLLSHEKLEKKLRISVCVDNIDNIRYFTHTHIYTYIYLYLYLHTNIQTYIDI